MLIRCLHPCDIHTTTYNASTVIIVHTPGTGGKRFANTLVFGLALRNKEEGTKVHSGGPQKCVLYCFPNEEMASEAAGKCDCTLGYILYHSGWGHNYWD